MNTGTTLGTAILRGFYNFLCTALVAGITCYLSMMSVIPNSVTDGPAPAVSERDIIVVSVLTGLLAGLAVLGFRGGVEGLADRSRQQIGDVKPNDVQPNPAGHP